MDNRYISRYAKHDTHFARTDPFKHVAWKGEESKLSKVLSAAGFVLCLLVLIFCGSLQYIN